MKLTIVLAGKVKDNDYQRIINDYATRLNSFVNFEFRELKVAEDLPLKDKEIVKLFELGKDSFKIAMDLEGESYTSESFANFLNDTLNIKKNVVFYIGGAFGLGKQFLSRCDKLISLSRMTMAHKVALLVLFEQIYRAFTIISGHPYHK
ncbi:23S rRNA (pseudouridine(1915)-N(3))-methyltransferase RlmH [Calditerrivibrio sp.]|jgi:23S rRNA (pseudouridine1915-N3)-methyltransferase|uniref:23S rRNA (pseudouridine(1915)-N(3))-methyltransferase RlmH n=1 Tax=Calditerrivibrio sp. TaxID=2792612 RepID=UPI003D0A98E7